MAVPVGREVLNGAVVDPHPASLGVAVLVGAQEDEGPTLPLPFGDRREEPLPAPGTGGVLATVAVHHDDLVLFATEPLQASVGMLHEAAQRVEQRGGAAGLVALHGQVGRVLDVDGLVDDLEGRIAVELHQGQRALARSLAMLGHESIEATDHIRPERLHRSRAVDEKRDVNGRPPRLREVATSGRRRRVVVCAMIGRLQCTSVVHATPSDSRRLVVPPGLEQMIAVGRDTY